MCLSKFLKRIERAFFPCSEKLQNAFADFNGVCDDAKCRVQKKSAEFREKLPVTAFPQFSNLISPDGKLHVRNPK